ncbi:MAG: HAMP domain-containing protein [Chloroflexi bacterium]|nr:HAMP domain-containing protein [Chloroflexota bacterium]
MGRGSVASFRSLRAKAAWLTLGVMLLPLLVTTVFGGWLTARILREQLLARAVEDAEEQAFALHTFLQQVRREVRYLAQLRSLQGMLEALASGDQARFQAERRHLAEDFLIFARTHPVYYQIRVLDVEGQEIVRVNQPLGQAPYVVPDDQLQNKAHRYYVQEALKLPPGGIYVSPLDLNQEFHTIERPLHPVLRYATPLDWRDQRLGVLVVNLHAQPLLDILYQVNARRRSPVTLILVDREGYYLAHPDPDKRWGGPRDLDTGEGLYRDAPDIAAEVLSGKRGVLFYKDEVWVYLPIYPAPEDQPNEYWVLIRREPKAQLFAAIRTFQLWAGGVLLLAVLLAGAMSWWVARSITAPVRALSHALERFGRDARDLVRLPVRSQDEIGQLTAAFNRMTSAVQRDMRYLRILNRGMVLLARQRDPCRVLHHVARLTGALLQVPWVGLYEPEDLAEGAAEPAANAKEPPARRAWRVTACSCGPAPERVELPAVSDPQVARWYRTETSDGQAVWVTYLDVRRDGPRYAMVLPAPEPERAERAEPWLRVLLHQAETVLQNLRLYARLRHHQQQLSDLLNRLISAQEEERKLVAYDLHDGLIQTLVGAHLSLNNYLMLRNLDPEKAEALLRQALQDLQRAIREGRRLIQGLRPTVLDDLGLALAVQEVVEAMATEQGWQVDLQIHLPRKRLPPSVEITAFRILQEALNNVRKHAAAKRVQVSLYVKDGRLYGRVQDDGRGFDPQNVARSAGERAAVGLHSMRERARLLGGEWNIVSQPGAGTTVTFWLPLPEEEGEDGG